MGEGGTSRGPGGYLLARPGSCGPGGSRKPPTRLTQAPQRKARGAVTNRGRVWVRAPPWPWRRPQCAEGRGHGAGLAEGVVTSAARPSRRWWVAVELLRCALAFISKNKQEQKYQNAHVSNKEQTFC